MADPRVYAVLLAAGASTRFGTENKLLAPVGNQPLVARSVARLAAADVSGILAVVASGAAGDAVSAALRDQPVEIVVNVNAAAGMGSSIACGVAAVSDPGAGIMILPADMPSLDPSLIDSLIDAYQKVHGDKIVHPATASGEQRNPVIWPPWARPDLLRLKESQGGKTLLAKHRERTLTLTASQDEFFEDIDTKEDLARFTKRTRT